MKSSSLQLGTFELLSFPHGVRLSLIPFSNASVGKLKVFNGCINDWKACSRWRPSNGALDYFAVISWPPSVSPMFSPMPIYGDASNSQVMYFIYCSLDLNFFCSHQLKQKRKRKSTVIGCVIVIRYPFLRSSTSDYIFFSNFAVFSFLVVFLP
ncbi:uncharacterized protein LOC115718720 [Cannabis sativa]|uniref:uncharacterized protein LOC115718720 n=1 Tax=Cannabis sativa TaxID=3483 RepID=UPI0029CA6E7B|nr:uncharacterized protein LOC115718720 [Cannabis sativa]